ncbi:hypothetical protein STRAU_5479 [Streptomyces aurantiacus JA 4570]|uniref:KAP NTPase domain-containing protein n=2 Tax=Streptomyces aurantiacus TaxID=47760 RepID=S3ZSU4_9ACTN|nr:hypothetical protein STRAU_5479 [Streptomyces aurantiacus JA 4570]
MEEAEDKRQDAVGEAAWDWRIVCPAIAVGAVVLLVTGGLMALLVAVLTAALTLLVLSWRGTAAWINLRQCFVAAAFGCLWLVQRIRLGICAARWGEALFVMGAKPLVERVIRHLLGDDPDSVFVPASYEGLRAPRAPGYIVSNEAVKQLQRKLSQIDDGTIAVCGPRGAGKSTLLQECVKSADFGLLVQAPATYAPHDFVLSLSVRMCEEYIRKEGYSVPEFTRLSPFHRFLRQARLRIKRLGRWSAFAVPSLVLLVLGLSASVRSLYAQYANTLADSSQANAESIRDWAREVWDGHAVAASVAVSLGGIAWWRARDKPWLPRLLAWIWAQGGTAIGMGLAVISVGSVAYDKQLEHNLDGVRSDTFTDIVVLAGVWWLCRREDDAELRLGSWRIPMADFLGAVSTFSAAYLLYYLIHTPETYPLIADPENPLRLAGAVTGLLLARASGWRPRPAEPEVVTRCRNHLFRLQTVQMTTNTASSGASQILSLGGSHATSVSTVPPNFPELVEDFRSLLGLIAAEKAAKNQIVVVAIDEVDRLGSDTQALAFLAEVKAILGIRHVYYLISVAEDVGAAFVRRGLPHRDVTDSSLDDIVQVPPSTLEESRTILGRRSETLTAPYCLLAHALSGGILRDLLRYGLQITEMQAKTKSHELTHIARRLILEELSETLAGFRTLLSKEHWTQSTSGILTSFRTLSSYLRTSCPCTEASLQHALEDFAFYAVTNQPGPTTHAELPDTTRQLVDEASAYAYFSLTLLDIFAAPRLDHRTEQAAEHGLDGAPESLAEARLELGISPYSARTLIDSIRKAWSLPLGPSATDHAPTAHPGRCSVHDPEAGAPPP